MKNMSKICIVVTILGVLGMIGGTSVYKVIRRHHDRLLLVSEKRIVEKARLCFNEEKCTNDAVTLKTLYQLHYLTNEVNPVTKEYYKEDSYVKKEDTNQYTFVVVD